MYLTTLLRTKGWQVVRLPDHAGFPESVHEVAVLRDGTSRVIVPAAAIWDDFFDSPGVDLGERDQPTIADSNISRR